MVMGFALCASVAFAQTARISHMDNALTKAPTKATKAAVDYKASIFTKANGHDTIQCFKIDVPSDYTIGIVSASDRINDTLVGSTNAHSIPGDINSQAPLSMVIFQARILEWVATPSFNGSSQHRD